VAAFGIAYTGFAFAPASIPFLVAPFVVAGVAIGCVETAEHAAVVALAPERVRGSAFGLLAFLQAAGNLAASAIAGLLWTAISPEAAFAYLVGWMILALAALIHAAPRR
jgi:MFS family permease